MIYTESIFSTLEQSFRSIYLRLIFIHMEKIDISTKCFENITFPYPENTWFLREYIFKPPKLLKSKGVRFGETGVQYVIHTCKYPHFPESIFAL